MLEFLLSLVLTTFSLKAVLAPSDISQKIISNFQKNLPEVITTIIPPIENPSYNQLTHLSLHENNTENKNPEKEITSYEENQTSENNSSDNRKHPNTNKSEAFNTQSEKVIGNVANVAIVNSPSLEPYDEPEDPSPSLTPTPSPTPTPPIITPAPDPKPTIYPCPPPPCLPHYPNSEAIGRSEIYPCVQYNSTTPTYCID